MATASGYVYSYLAALPMIFDYNASRVVYLTSLLEMSVMDITRRAVTAKLTLEMEPSFTGLGPSHAAVGMNNQASVGGWGWGPGGMLQCV